MFEIGSSLREARERRRLELGEVERDTRIRVRYLRALEAEQFERLPGRAYAKGFLRTYADYLGLDADRFVDELASRLPVEEEEIPLQPRPEPVGRRRRRLLAPVPVVALAVAVSVVVVILVLGSTKGTKRVVPPPKPPPAGVVGQKAISGAGKHRSQLATLVLRAGRGRCWIEAHAGSRNGRRLYFSMLEQGHSLRLSNRRLWLRIGVPATLSATLNGRAIALPRTSPVDLLVTPRGVAVAYGTR